MNTPLAMVPGKSDQEVADDLKKRLIEVYKPLLALLDEAQAKGFVVQVQTGVDAFGKNQIAQLMLAKEVLDAL